MTSLLAYHNNPALKDGVLALLAQHREADQIIRGKYWENGKGCAVGCTLESIRQIRGASDIEHSDHALYERYLGIPIMLARLEDGIFEALENGEAKQWPERFASAIRPGADLSMVGPKFLRDLLSAPDGGVQRRLAQRQNPRVTASVQTVSDLYGRWIEGVKPSCEDWQAARSAAAAAAAAAAADASASADASAADASASAAASAAAAAACLRELRRQADVLIALLEAA